MRLTVHDILLRLLGLLLLTAAGLKGHELLTVPAANADIWSNRLFLIFQVEFELALGIWLLSGLFKRAAWLAALGCFGVFCAVTLYKALAGFGSCGCFGRVHVSPWVTLFAVDLPAVVLLICFFPPIAQSRESLNLRKCFHFVSHIAVLILLTAFFLISSRTERRTFESSTVISKGYPYDLTRSTFSKEPVGAGYKLVLFYRRDCPGCVQTIHLLKDMNNNPLVKSGKLDLRFIEISFSGTRPMDRDGLITSGLLANSANHAMRPILVFMKDKLVFDVWNTGDFDHDSLQKILSFVSGQIRKDA